VTTFFPYIHLPIYKAGGIQFDAFAILVALGVVVGALLARHRTEQIGLDLDVTIDSFYWVLPGGFLISHVIDVVCYKPQMVAKDPLILLYAWAGISSFGGILGGFAVAYYFFRRRKLPGLPYMDVLGWGLLVGFTIGRIGCTVAHDHPGLSMPAKLVSAYHVAMAKGKAVVMPALGEPSVWIGLLLFGFTAALLASLIREESVSQKGPLLIGGATVGIGALLYPSMPGLLRSLAVPRPQYSSLFFKVQMPPMLIWGDFQANIGGKMQLIKTQVAYDLGLIELIFCVFLCLAGWVLINGKPRREGFFLACWFLAYPPFRFLFDELRLVDKTYMGLTPGQYMAIIMYVAGLYLAFHLPERRWGEYRPLEVDGEDEDDPGEDDPDEDAAPQEA